MRGRATALLLVLLTSVPVRAIIVRTRLARPARGYQVRLTPFTVPPRTEREVCQAIELPDRRAFDSTTITFASPGTQEYFSHHFALFVDDADDLTSLPQGPTESPGCVGFGQNFGAIIGGIQSPRGSIHLPAGVGWTFQPNQVVLLDLHYVNASTSPVTVSGAVNLPRARRGTVVHHARGFQVGTTRIDVPPGEDGSATGTWIAPFPMNVVFLSTHSHRHTRSVDVDLIRAGADAGQLLQTVDWEHPTQQTLNTPLHLAAGDGFRWTCDYHNDTAKTLTFGITSEDEMCFTIGSFYLDDDAETLPAVPGCFGGDVALTCPGF